MHRKRAPKRIVGLNEAVGPILGSGVLLRQSIMGLTLIRYRVRAIPVIEFPLKDQGIVRV